MIFENWQRHTWTYSHQGILKCFETMPSINRLEWSWVSRMISSDEQRFADLLEPELKHTTDSPPHTNPLCTYSASILGALRPPSIVSCDKNELSY